MELRIDKVTGAAKYTDDYEATGFSHASMFPKEAFKTATVDRGKEFACYPIIESDLGIPVYFADPYSSWQRDTNENANGLLREFFPKKTYVSKVDISELEEALLLIENA